MACETCDHTMQCVINQVFWCPRCGTLQTPERVEAPMLVERFKTFREPVRLDHTAKAYWHAIGLDESICKPEERT